MTGIFLFFVSQQFLPFANFVDQKKASFLLALKALLSVKSDPKSGCMSTFEDPDIYERGSKKPAF